jgi:hypothetical protein
VHVTIRDCRDFILAGRRVALDPVWPDVGPYERWLTIGCDPYELWRARAVAKAHRRTPPLRYGTRARQALEIALARAVIADLGWTLTDEERLILDEAARGV